MEKEKESNVRKNAWESFVSSCFIIYMLILVASVLIQIGEYVKIIWMVCFFGGWIIPLLIGVKKYTHAKQQIIVKENEKYRDNYTRIFKPKKDICEKYEISLETLNKILEYIRFQGLKLRNEQILTISQDAFEYYNLNSDWIEDELIAQIEKVKQHEIFSAAHCDREEKICDGCGEIHCSEGDFCDKCRY